MVCSVIPCHEGITSPCEIQGVAIKKQAVWDLANQSRPMTTSTLQGQNILRDFWKRYFEQDPSRIDVNIQHHFYSRFFFWKKNMFSHSVCHVTVDPSWWPLIMLLRWGWSLQEPEMIQLCQILGEYWQNRFSVPSQSFEPRCLVRG